ncbi:MAG TPA: tannase/feruloyl esterase family alpha/beta hydrolase [Gammaproteobacteria bacterium]|nr:tannase/feruloyl esterase family alpha/beta hydrolase [Gammaproteobacteria bacterium]
MPSACKLSHAVRGSIVLASLLALTSTPAPAQLFADADASVASYTQADIAPAMSCADLAGIELPDVIAISAGTIPAEGEVPSHCRVDGTIDPEIAFQVNLPATWNGRFYMVGNGGPAGQHPDTQAAARAQALAHGFAMGATDTGHDSREEPGFTFGLERQKAIDYAFRAVHVTAVTAKAIADAYYAEPVRYAYWNSCSNGGRQGMLEAQRYPDDFDGIIANAPWVDQTGFAIGAIWNQQAVADAGLTPGKLAVLSEAVLDKCDAVDGLQDGLIDNPRQCDIEVADDVPLCAAGVDDDSCLTPDQASAVQKVYDGPRDSTGRQLMSGFMPGSESAWMGLVVPATPDAVPGDFNLAQGIMQYMVFQPPRPDWDYRDFDFDRDPELLDRWSRLANATDIDLRDFRANGGKLIMTYGWSDQVLQPMMGVDYYERAVTANGPNGEAFMRLFMLPGMTHCAGGPGPDQHDPMTAIVDWVEAGMAPERMIARKIEDGQVTRSRPLCPYPDVARHDGTGSIDEAASFSCRAP